MTGTDTLRLRDYQRACIDAVFDAWAAGMCRPAVVLPTGAGKTVVFSALVSEWRGWYWGNDAPASVHGASRVIVLVHRDELADQALAKLRAVLPEDVTVGKVKAADNDVHADVMVCSVQTLNSAKRRDALVGRQHLYGKVGLIITDECHHAAAASYQKVYADFPGALQLGVTATLARGDGVGLGDVWEDVVYRKSVLWMISEGHLTDVEAKRVDLFDVDLGSVKTSRGDYQAGDLGKALMDADAHLPIAKAYVEHAAGRRGLVFTPTVATAEATADALNAAGVDTAVISGDTPRDERLRTFEDFRTGRVQVLSNCMVLTEGFDAPWAEVAVIARPTQSQPLYVQMVGRVLRPYPGKDKALVLDVVGASASSKLRTLIDLAPGSVQQVRDGETLAEAAETYAEEQNSLVPGSAPTFQMRVKDANLFAGSEHAWMRTPKGVLYVNCGEVYVFLWPSQEQPGLWDVCTAGTKGGKWQRTRHTGLDIGSAMAWGEAVSETDAFSFSTKRDARWRNSTASEKQINYARALGVPSPEGMTRGQLSEAIDAVTGAQFFDRYV